jgi:hypothetical protein
VPRVEGHVRGRRWSIVTAGAFALLVAAWCGTAAGTAPPASLTSLLAPGAKLKLFAGGLGYAEGPLWLPDGHLIVSDIYANSVVEFDAADKKSVFRRPSNSANGHALDAHGSVIEADSGGSRCPGRIVKVAADGTATVLADNYQGKRPEARRACAPNSAPRAASKGACQAANCARIVKSSVGLCARCEERAFLLGDDAARRLRMSIPRTSCRDRHRTLLPEQTRAGGRRRPECA